MDGWPVDRAGLGGDWRVVDGVVTAWFDAPTLSAGAALAGRVLGESPGALVDLRATGARVRLDSPGHAGAVTEAARELGLSADPAALQHVGVVLESPDPAAVRPFWQRALDYAPLAGGLADPLRRDPALLLRAADEPRPLRNRVHLDVVRPEGVVEREGLGEATGPFGVRHTDADGNEVDLVPGGALEGTADTADWAGVFSAMACYRVSSTTQQLDVASAAAALADDAGFPLLVDLRPGLVVLDSGKDRWEADAHGLGLEFTDLAGAIQAAAREHGAAADPALPRFVQLFLDAADVPALRAFWSAALGYAPDRRDWVTDLDDPRRLNPVLSFQEIDRSETERRRQRNRLHMELAVPPDAAHARLATITAAGGRLLDEAPGRWRIADPELNELVLTSAT